ncbi:hypothetical protein ACLI4Q_18815 [Natrialbaceae archaeon A-CW1-1]
MAERKVRWRLKFLLICGFVSLAVVVLSVRAASPDGYEMSIYESHGWWLWGSLILMYALGTLVVFHSVTTDGKGYFLSGAVLILLITGSLLLMPVIRGYFAYGGGDMLTHKGHVHDILITGHIGDRNYYPLTHISAGIVLELTGIGFFSYKGLITPIFTLVYGAGLFLFVRAFTLQTGTHNYLLPLVFLPIFKDMNLYFGPHMISFSLYPLLLFVLLAITRYRTRHVLVLIILFGYILFSHPITTIWSLTTVGLIGIATSVTFIVQNRTHSVTRLGPTVTVPLIVVIGFLWWYYNFRGPLVATISGFRALIYRSGETDAGGYSTAIEAIPLSPLDLFAVILFRFGSEFILLSASALTAGYLLYRFARSDINWLPQYLFLIISFGFFSSVSVVFLVTDFVIFWTRVLKFSQLFGIALVGIASVFFIQTTLTHRRRLVVMVVIILLFSLILFGMYSSPYQRAPSSHLTEAQVDSMDWFLGYRPTPQEVYSIDSIYRYEDALSGVESEPRTYTDNPVPPHFGYNDSATFATADRPDGYLIVTTRLKQWYPALHPDYPEHWQYTPADFEQLDRDTNLGKIYTNNETETYQIRT